MFFGGRIMPWNGSEIQERHRKSPQTAMLRENVKDFLFLFRPLSSPAQFGDVVSGMSHMVSWLSVKGSHATCSVCEDFSAFFFCKWQAKKSFQDRLLIYTFPAVTAVCRGGKGRELDPGSLHTAAACFGFKSQTPSVTRAGVSVGKPSPMGSNSATHPTGRGSLHF